MNSNSVIEAKEKKTFNVAIVTSVLVVLSLISTIILHYLINENLVDNRISFPTVYGVQILSVFVLLFYFWLKKNGRKTSQNMPQLITFSIISIFNIVLCILTALGVNLPRPF